MIQKKCAKQVCMPDALRNELIAIAKTHRPYEACGTVLAKVKPNNIEICGICICENNAKDKMAGFRLSRKDIERTKVNWVTRSNRIVGIFHTHGLGDATPSIHDRLVMRSKPGLYFIANSYGDIQAFSSSFNKLVRLEFAA